MSPPHFGPDPKPESI